MANFAILKAAIQAVIKQNGNNEITGDLLQQALLSMIGTLGAGYQFVGVAVLTPTPTNPGTPDNNVCYFVSEPGVYANFGSLVVDNGELAIFKYNGTWVKDSFMPSIIFYAVAGKLLPYDGGVSTLQSDPSADTNMMYYAKSNVTAQNIGRIAKYENGSWVWTNHYITEYEKLIDLPKDNSITLFESISANETNILLRTVKNCISGFLLDSKYTMPLWLQQGSFGNLVQNSVPYEIDDNAVVRTNEIYENEYYVEIPDGYSSQRLKFNAAGAVIGIGDVKTESYLEINANAQRVYDRLLLRRTDTANLTPGELKNAGFGCVDENFNFFNSIRLGFVVKYPGGVAALRADEIESVKHYNVYVNDLPGSPNYKTLMWWNGVDWAVRTDYTFDDIVNHTLLMPEIGIDDTVVSVFKTWSSSLLQKELLNDGAMVESSAKIGLSKVLKKNKDKRFVNILCMTDSHANDHNAIPSFAAAKQISQSDLPDCSIHIGDIITTYDMDNDAIINGLLEWNNYVKGVSKEILVAKGNHDCGHDTTTPSQNITNTQFRLLFQNKYPDAVFNDDDPECLYFYVDFEDKKTRIIVLDSHYDSVPQTVNFGQYQPEWLYNTAFNFTGKAGWNVIVFVHFLGNTIYDNRNEEIVSVLRAFANKGETYGEYTFDPNIDVDLVGVIHGHRHADYYDNTYNINYVGVRAAYGDNPNVSILTIDADNGILYETEITGTDRAFTFPTATQIVE